MTAATASCVSRRCPISNRVFVGNLSFQTTKDELLQLLSGAGQVVDLHIPSDRMTGQPRGFAFAEFSTSEEAAAAIAKFDGQELNGRQLRVNIAEDRPAGGGRPSGGGGHRPSFDNRDGRKPFKNKGSRRGLRGRKRSL
jgi:cold-inducible RNA-binding protein